jgi:SsrA-binding protein
MAKLEIGFAEKKTYDKRESLKEQDTKRDLDRIKRFTLYNQK